MRPFLRQCLRLSAATLLMVMVISAPGCRKKSPEDRLAEAQALIQEKQIPMATIRLKDLVADSPESEAAIAARYMLAQLYTEYQNEEYYRRALEELRAIYDKVGLNDSRGFDAYSMATDILLVMEKIDEALAHLEAGVDKAAEAQGKEHLRMMAAALRLTMEDEAQQAAGREFFTDAMMNHEEASVRGQAREVLARYHADNEQFAEANQVYQQYILAFPDETIIPQLEIAQALNLKRMSDEGQADEVFTKASAKMLKQIDEELNLDSRARLLNDLAMYHAAFGDTAGGIELLRRVMAENVRTMTAIQAQFRIGEFLTRSQETWPEALEHFEKMVTENPNTNVGQQAANAVQVITQRLEELAKQDGAAMDAVTVEGAEPDAEAEAEDTEAP